MVHIVVFIIRIYHDALSSECQNVHAVHKDCGLSQLVRG